jgi:flagella basal body P-ring formation protein FlgA
MPRTRFCAVIVAIALATTPVAGAATAEVVRIQADDLRSLQDELVNQAQRELRATGLFVDRQRVRMSLSAPLPAFGAFYIRRTWAAELTPPPLPLTFEVVPVARATTQAASPESAEFGASARVTQVILAVALQQEVWVAVRQLPKGSVVACADLTLERRDLRSVPRQALANPCEIDSAAVAQRDIAARDVIRSSDVGRALDVTAGTPVNVTVATGGISVTTNAIALADARVGDLISVRLQRPARTLHTRVIGPGSVQLVDGS